MSDKEEIQMLLLDVVLNDYCWKLNSKCNPIVFSPFSCQERRPNWFRSHISLRGLVLSWTRITKALWEACSPNSHYSYNLPLVRFKQTEKSNQTIKLNLTALRLTGALLWVYKLQLCLTHTSLIQNDPQMTEPNWKNRIVQHSLILISRQFSFESHFRKNLK